MAVINDIYEKVRHWKPLPTISIYAEDHAEKLKCSLCGNEYVSRGRWDSGICRECERKELEEMVGNANDKG